MECQKCKEHAKELKTQAAKLETMAQEMRKAQDREAKLREELSSIFVRLVQYNMCSVEELALLTKGLHLSGEYLEQEKNAIRREAGKDAPPEELDAVRKAEPVGRGGAAFAKADDPAATAKSAAKSVEEEQSERLLNESIFFGTARSFSNGEEMATRIKQLLVEVGAHKLRMGVVLKNKANLSERAKKAETENKSMKKKVQETEKRLASSRLTTPAVAAGAAAKRVLMTPGSAEDKESTDDGGDTGEDEADLDPKRKLGRQRRVEKIVRKLDDLDRAKAVLTRSLSMETKLRIAAEEEVARLRDLLDRLRKSHRHQKLPEIEEANRLLNAQLGRAPSTANLEQRSPLSPSGDSLQLVERKYRTRERERLRGGVRGKHIGGGGLSSGSQSQVLDERVGGIGGNFSAFPAHSLDSIEAEFASCPVQKLRLKREELRKEEEFLQQMARGLSGSMHHQGGSAAYGAVGGGQKVNKAGGGAASYGQKPAGAGGGPGPVTQEPFLAHLRDKNMLAASDDHCAASKLLQ